MAPWNDKSDKQDEAAGVTQPEHEPKDVFDAQHQASVDGDAAASDDGKDTTPAQPETLAPENSGVAAGNPSDPTAGVTTTPLSPLTQDQGVQTGGLSYVENEDGTRNYPHQDKNVDVEVEEATE